MAAASRREYPGGGAVSLWGSRRSPSISVGSKRKRVNRAGTVTFKLSLNRHLHGRKLGLKIIFVPRVGPKLTKRITVTLPQ